MGESTFITKETDASGKDIAVWKGANDDTYIQQVAITDDDGDLLAKAQASYVFVSERPHLTCHGGVG
jgi:hypothetical protein